MNRLWCLINGHQHYFISNAGNVKSLKCNISGKELKISDNGKGYKCVKIRSNGRLITHYIHRLVATHFIDNPQKYKEVNHKDGNKSNNHYLNLEWCNRLMNVTHAKENGLLKGYDKHGKSNPRYNHGLRQVVNENKICIGCLQQFVAKYPTSIYCNKKCSGSNRVRKVHL